MKRSSPAEAPAMSGAFRVTCARREDGCTAVREQHVSAPFHLSKPYWTGDVLVVQAVNATAGVFAGDRLGMSVAALPGARVLLTSPSAHRVHTMERGRATFEQELSVGAGAWLELMPELFIPQAGCRYAQSTDLRVEEGGELYFAETLAPGRVARGERFAFEEVSWRMNLRYGDRLMARERYVLRRDDASTWSLRHPFETGYYAGVYMVTPRAGELVSRQAAVHELQREGCLVGMSRLDEACWSVKLLAAESELLRDRLRALRALLADVLPGLRADARKL
jgi:urease accessory protein